MSALLALIPAIFLGVGQLGIGKVGGRTDQQLLGVSTGTFLVGLVAWPLFDPHFEPIPVLICLGCGVLLFAGNALIYVSYRLSGVAYSAAVTTCEQLILVSALGVALFGEWATGSARLSGAAALVLLGVGAALAVYQERRAGADPAASPARRFAVVTAASIPYSIYPIIVAASGAEPDAVGTPLTAGLCAASLVFTLARARSSRPAAPEDALFSARTARLIPAGLVWGSGVLGMLWCNAHVGVATSFPLAQLNVVIAVVGGIVFLGETKTRKEKRAIALGVVLLLIGAVLIGVAKSLDAVA